MNIYWDPTALSGPNLVLSLSVGVTVDECNDFVE